MERVARCDALLAQIDDVQADSKQHPGKFGTHVVKLMSLYEQLDELCGGNNER